MIFHWQTRVPLSRGGPVLVGWVMKLLSKKTGTHGAVTLSTSAAASPWTPRAGAAQDCSGPALGMHALSGSAAVSSSEL
jgi:hypothetical protein